MIRPATPADAQAIAALWNWMIDETLATFTTDIKTLREIKDMISARPGAFFVADDGAGVSGFVTFGRFRSGPGYAATCEHSVVVSPNAHGEGIGRALMAQAESAARSQKMHVMVGAISGANPDAVAFHHKCGFEETGLLPQVGWKRGQWLDLVLVQKILDLAR